MALKTFKPPIPPSPGTSNKPEFKILKSEFGDGYTQRTADGINHRREIVSLKWDILKPEDAELIESFFVTHGGYLPFLYETVVCVGIRRWTCDEYSRSVDDGGFHVISATFKEYFGF